MTRVVLTAPALSLAALLALAGPASAADGAAEADLTPVALSGVQATGIGQAEISGTTLSFTLAAQGLLAGAPHAAHIHFGAEARNECPVAADDAAGDGTLNTTDGDPAYGPIVVSLTKTGDTSPESGLAIDRFGVGDDFEYSRGDVTVTQEVADAILAGKAAVVVHGVDHNDSGTYDGDVMSDLDPTLPTEATDPAICGVLNAMPAGGVATGAGSTSGPENLGLIGVGGLALLGGAALIARRRSTTNV